MADEALKKYVQQAQQAGATNDEIKSALAQASWSEADINKALTETLEKPQDTRTNLVPASNNKVAASLAWQAAKSQLLLLLLLVFVSIPFMAMLSLGALAFVPGGGAIVLTYFIALAAFWLGVLWLSAKGAVKKVSKKYSAPTTDAVALRGTFFFLLFMLLAFTVLAAVLVSNPFTGVIIEPFWVHIYVHILLQSVVFYFVTRPFLRTELQVTTNVNLQPLIESVSASRKNQIRSGIIVGLILLFGSLLLGGVIEERWPGSLIYSVLFINVVLPLIIFFWQRQKAPLFSKIVLVCTLGVNLIFFGVAIVYGLIKA